MYERERDTLDGLLGVMYVCMYERDTLDGLLGAENHQMHHYHPETVNCYTWLIS